MANAKLEVEATDNGSSRRIAKEISNIGKEASAAGYSVRSLDHLLSVLGAGMVISKFASFADEWQNIHNKLLNVTNTANGMMGNLNAVNQALFEGAQKSRVAYGEFVNVYQELAVQAKRFGVSQKDMVGLTTTMMEAAQMAHPSLAAMKAGVEQLILSMERGQLQTRGFSALLKDTPQLAKAIADGLGIGIDKLRELAHKGAVTAPEIIAALKKAGPEVEQQFFKLQPTIEGAMTVMHNGWIKFIGDLDASTGIIGGVTSLIIGMANHVDLLAALLVVFGGVAAAAFSGVALRAVKAFGLALKTALTDNPIGVTIVAIGVLVGLIAIFGDKISVTSDGVVSLMDYIKGVGITLGEWFTQMGHWFASVWDDVKPSVSGFVDFLGMLFSTLLGAVKTVVNAMIGTFVFGYKAIVLAWSDLPGALKNILTEVFNWIMDKFAGVTNSIINGINRLSNFAGLGTIDPVVVPKYEDDGKAAAFGKKIAGAAHDAYSEDYLGEAGHAIAGANSWLNAHDPFMRHAREVAARRNAATGLGVVGTEHGPPDPADVKGKKSKVPAKTRQEYIDEEMRKFRDQTREASDASITPLTENAYKEVTKFNDDLMKKRDKKGHYFPGLSPEEKQSLLDMVQGYEDANRVQKERFAIWNELIEPQQKYNDQMKATVQLEQAHVITASQAAQAERKAAIAFLDKQTDEASGKMLGQLKILEQLDDVAKPLASAMESIWKDQGDEMRTYQIQLTAINELLKDQLITADKAQDAIRKAQTTYLDAQTDAMSGVTRALLKIRDEADDAAKHMETAITDAFNGLEDAWVKLTTGQKFDAKSALKTVQEDLAKAEFQSLKGQLAGFLQDKFGVKLPGLAGKIGESRANPMWVRSADHVPGTEAQGIAGLGSAGLGGMFNFSGMPGMMGKSGDFTPISGDTSKWDRSFKGLNDGLKDTFDKSTINLGQVISAGVAMLGQEIGNLIGGKAGGFLGTVLQVGGQIAEAYFSHGGTFATGGDFIVGGAGGVDSQNVSFKASPGERVSISRPGESQRSGGGGGDFYHLEIDARGTSPEEVERRIDMAMARAMPMARKVAREDAVKDVAMRSRRQKLAGAR